MFVDDLDINENELTSIIKFAEDTTFLVKVCKAEADLSDDVIS